MNRFLAWLDSRHFVSIRAFTLGVTLWMTWDAYQWAADFAAVSTFDSVGTAAVIGAVTGPISLMQGAVFKFYMDAKK